MPRTTAACARSMLANLATAVASRSLSVRSGVIPPNSIGRRIVHGARQMRGDARAGRENGAVVFRRGCRAAAHVLDFVGPRGELGQVGPEMQHEVEGLPERAVLRARP